MNADNNISNGHEQKKKQKPGLNAIRPDDYTEQKFKDLAKENGLSQTEMFERFFWTYLKAENDEKRQAALNLEGEISLISKDLNNILMHFKTIADKAQNTIISIKSNAQQTQANLTLEIDTYLKRIQELEKRNLEIEQANATFTDIKEGLDNRITELAEIINDKDTEIKYFKETIKAKDKEIQESANKNLGLEKDVSKLQKEIDRLSQEVHDKSERISSLESSNRSLSDVLSNMEVLKKSEISSIEAKYKLINTDQETKIKSLKERSSKELQDLRDSLKIELEADKKFALADMKLELADVKSKYAEALYELNSIKQKRKTED